MHKHSRITIPKALHKASAVGIALTAIHLCGGSRPRGQRRSPMWQVKEVGQLGQREEIEQLERRTVGTVLNDNILALRLLHHLH
jgi:hypothetical protein